MEFQKAMRALHHICWAHDECKRCPMHIVCCEGISERPEEAEAILTKWAAEHPEKTRLDDFLDKYPKAALDDNDTPRACAKNLGYCTECIDAGDLDMCDACWRRPLEEVE